MLSVLAAGSLVSDPRRRTSASGKEFATANVRVAVEDAESMLVSVIAFEQGAVASLMLLAKGDACAIAGRGKVASWEKNGEQRHGLSVVADRVLTAYAAGKLRKAARENSDEGE